MWRGYFKRAFTTLVILLGFHQSLEAYGSSDREAAEAELQSSSKKRESTPSADELRYQISSVTLAQSKTDANLKSWQLDAGISFHTPYGSFSPLPQKTLAFHEVAFGPHFHISSCHKPMHWRASFGQFGICGFASYAQAHRTHADLRFELRDILLLGSLIIERHLLGPLDLQVHAQWGAEFLTYAYTPYGLGGSQSQTHLSFGPTFRLKLGEVPFFALGYRYQLATPEPHHTSLSMGVHFD